MQAGLARIARSRATRERLSLWGLVRLGGRGIATAAAQLVACVAGAPLDVCISRVRRPVGRVHFSYAASMGHMHFRVQVPTGRVARTAERGQ